jgi:TldD protein
MTVVLGPGWPGVLLHEAVGTAWRRLQPQGLQRLQWPHRPARGRQGRDGAGRRHHGRPPRLLNIDDEGHATQRNVLIEDGILKGYIQDALNARLMKGKPTGNGGAKATPIPMPRMTNTYMLAGDKDPRRSSPASSAACTPPTSAAAGRHHQRQVRVLGQPGLLGRERQDPVPVKGATIVGSGPKRSRR